MYRYVHLSYASQINKYKKERGKLGKLKTQEKVNYSKKS
jgi:hypothetical protein